MDVKTAVNELIERGWTEKGIADYLRTANQSTINRIKHGKSKRPRFIIKAGILALHASQKLPVEVQLPREPANG